MPIQIEDLDTDDWESLHKLCLRVYAKDQCYEFAAALHRGLDWSLVGLVHDDVIYHVYAAAGDGKLWDVRGPVRQAKSGKPFKITQRYVRKPLSEGDLWKIRPLRKDAIDRALLFAQALWPQLPWRKGTFHKKALSFMDDLEAICRKHKVWIRAPFPAAHIVLSEMHGGEKGFTLSPTRDGQYLFDRIL